MTQNFESEQEHPREFPRCPEHPDQITFTSCSRCHRPTCGKCQIPLEVGTICTNCLPSKARRSPAARYNDSVPVITYALIAINVFAYLLQKIIPQYWMYIHFVYNPGYTVEHGEWWRLITSGFLHSQDNISHLLLNMLSLWIFGRALEPLLGRIKYLAIYLVSILGGSLAVWAFAELSGDIYTNTLGASGGIFGLFGAFFVMTKMRGENISPVLILIGINIVYSFVFPGISWQAHLGGLIAGALATLISQTLGAQRRL